MLKVLYMDVADMEPRIIQLEKGDILGIQELLRGSFDVMYPETYGMNGVFAKHIFYVNDCFLDGSFEPNFFINIEAMLKEDYNRAGLIYGPLILAGVDDMGGIASIADENMEVMIKYLQGNLLKNNKRESK
jgi:hypothetical protein